MQDSVRFYSCILIPSFVFNSFIHLSFQNELLIREHKLCLLNVLLFTHYQLHVLNNCWKEN